MARTSYTRQPCPGCGSTDKRLSYLKLCGKCSTKLRLGEKYQAILAERKEDESLGVLASIDLPRRPDPGSFANREPGSPGTDPVIAAIIDIALAISTEVADTGFFDAKGWPVIAESQTDTSRGMFGKKVRIDPRAIEPIQRAIKAVHAQRETQRRHAEDRYSAGFEHGKDLLFRLNDGSISLRDFKVDDKRGHR